MEAMTCPMKEGGLTLPTPTVNLRAGNPFSGEQTPEEEVLRWDGTRRPLGRHILGRHILLASGAFLNRWRVRNPRAPTFTNTLVVLYRSSAMKRPKNRYVTH